MIAESLNMCDPILQKALFKNIILSGGTSMLKGLGFSSLDFFFVFPSFCSSCFLLGFGERMKNELEKIFDNKKYQLDPPTCDSSRWHLFLSSFPLSFAI
jgi:actin-related protein